MNHQIIAKGKNRKVLMRKANDGDFLIDIVRLASADEKSNPVTSNRYSNRAKTKFIRVTSMKLTKEVIQMMWEGMIKYDSLQTKESV